MMQWMLHCSLTNGWPWKLRHSIKVSVALQEITPFWVVHHHIRSFWNSFSARGLCSHEPSTRRWHLWGIVQPSWYKNYQHNSAGFVLLDEGSTIYRMHWSRLVLVGKSSCTLHTCCWTTPSRWPQSWHADLQVLCNAVSNAGRVVWYDLLWCDITASHVFYLYTCNSII